MQRKKLKRFFQNCIKNILDAFFFPVLFLLCVMSRFFSLGKKNRIFFGVMANNNLVYVRDSLKKLGYEAQVIPWIIPPHEKDRIDYDFDIQKKFPRMYANFFGQYFLIIGFFIWTIFNFDIFITPFRNRLLDRLGFLNKLEFQLLKLAGKKILLNPYGGDIQVPEVWEHSDRKEFQVLYDAWMADPNYSQVNSEKTKKNNRYGQKYADAVIAAIDWPDYLDKEKLIFLHMRCVPKIAPLENTKKNQFFTIVHATNHPHFKGTSYLEKAVAAINANGKKCELKILNQQSNQAVLEAIKNADVVFDQVLLGAYGRLAIEAMSLGKPVICYLREDFMGLYPQWRSSFIVNTDITHLKETILNLIGKTDEEIKTLGKQTQTYAECYHSVDYVGKALDQILKKVLKDA